MEIKNPIEVAFANTGDRTNGFDKTSSDIGTVNWDKGFPAGFSKSINNQGKFVKRLDINYILWFLSAAIQYFQKGGIALYNNVFSGGEYEKDSVLWFKRANGKWVLIQAAKNTNVAPTDSELNTGTNWKSYKLLGYDGTMLTIDEAFTANENVTLEKNLSIRGNLQLGSGSRATGCPTPNNPNDFANKQYVDNKILLSNYSTFNIIAGESTYPSSATADPIHGAWKRNGVYSFTISRDCMLMIEYGGRTSGSLLEMSIHLSPTPTGISSPKCIFAADSTFSGEHTSCVYLEAGTVIYVKLGNESDSVVPSIRLSEVYND